MSRRNALIFAAFGDDTRLSIIKKLSNGNVCSISQLTKGNKISRQAITKHLHVLEKAGVITSTHSGRETLIAFNPRPINEMKAYLDYVSNTWDQTLSRLKTFVEE